MNKFYVTNAIPYVNARPHIGLALEYIESDTIRRYHHLLGEETLLLCGSDENSLKNVQAAEAEGQDVQSFVDSYAKFFSELAKKLNVEFDVFQKGSSPDHHKASQKLWKFCEENGDIYKKSYKGLYCVGCELFYTKEELNENGECFEHPGKPLQEVEEENYFFKLSNYQNQLLKLIESGEYQIVPEFRKVEMINFIKSGLQDFSISRSNERAKNWGVPVPGDDSQRMYVWFDALNIYQSGIGFGSDEEEYNKWWPADVHVIGKGIIRFHAIYWPAILMSAKLPLPKKLFVHEYLTINGQKISKTLGNVIDPIPLAEEYGADALRYYLLAKVSPFQDGDFTTEKLKEAYNSDLANGIGNLVARVSKLCERIDFEAPEGDKKFDPEVEELLKQFKFNEALSWIWQTIALADKRINEEKPWTLEGNELKEVLDELARLIQRVAFNLQPFLPETSEKILTQFSGKVKSSTLLFPRI